MQPADAIRGIAAASPKCRQRAAGQIIVHVGAATATRATQCVPSVHQHLPQGMTAMSRPPQLSVPIQPIAWPRGGSPPGPRWHERAARVNSSRTWWRRRANRSDLMSPEHRDQEQWTTLNHTSTHRRPQHCGVPR